MQGSYFSNSAKFFLTVLSTLLVYIQLVHYHPDLYFHFRALIVPLIVNISLFRLQLLLLMKLQQHG
jgi:hypothetical protein